ncbi:epsilon DNA polymerase [Irpex lacteus]|nr:epsilon DNA polymerase [Irpex lacteus]
MADPRQRAIIKVFRKYSHSLGPEALAFLEDICDKHDVPDDGIEDAIEHIAREYNKQDDAQMKVSLDVLRRVYNVFQSGGGGGGDAAGGGGGDDDDFLDLDAHLHFIDAYDMPLWNWSTERVAFERVPGPLTLSGSAESRVNAIRNRLNIIKQTILRNDWFSPSTLPSKNRENLLALRSSKQLLGRANERFLLFGMLSHNKEGKLCLEDEDGMVELDFSQLDTPSEGLFTTGCFALIEGDYTEDATLLVIAIGHPPCESREAAKSIFGHVDFLGCGARTVTEDAHLATRLLTDLPHTRLFVLSDVWLDRPETLVGLKKMFDHCVETDFIPHVVVLCGNFSERGVGLGARDLRRYQDGFDALADLITSVPPLARTTHFLLIPGPTDLTSSSPSLLPRRPLLSSFTHKLKQKVPKLHFGSNPCRVRVCEQEVVVFREDLMGRMLRNLVGVKPDVREDDLKRYLVQSILDQSHLVPLSNSIYPVHSEFDHSLRLYPLPTTVVLADKYERYQMTYEGCHVFNPGSFLGNAFGFTAYIPATRSSEECILGMDTDD